MTKEPFGPHITIDLKGCPKEILADYSLHFDFLKNLPEMIGMTPITQPYVFPYSGYAFIFWDNRNIDNRRDAWFEQFIKL